MNPSRILTALLAALILAAPTSVFAKKDELPQVTEDGLHLVPNSKLAIVYMEPGADLSQYERVKLLGAYVAFKKNWEKNQRSRSADKLRVTPADTEKIKDTLAAEFDEVFTRTLEEGGYEVVTESAEDVLLIRPAIINLNVAAPDTGYSGRTSSYTTSVGEMTLYLELYDSLTGDLITKALDRKVDNAARQGFYTWTNSSVNKRASDQILTGWAQILLDALNEAKQ
jgi:hypothetical protein